LGDISKSSGLVLVVQKNCITSQSTVGVIDVFSRSAAVNVEEPVANQSDLIEKGSVGAEEAELVSRQIADVEDLAFAGICRVSVVTGLFVLRALDVRSVGNDSVDWIIGSGNGVVEQILLLLGRQILSSSQILQGVPDFRILWLDVTFDQASFASDGNQRKNDEKFHG